MHTAASSDSSRLMDSFHKIMSQSQRKVAVWKVNIFHVSATSTHIHRATLSGFRFSWKLSKFSRYYFKIEINQLNAHNSWYTWKINDELEFPNGSPRLMTLRWLGNPGRTKATGGGWMWAGLQTWLFHCGFVRSFLLSHFEESKFSSFQSTWMSSGVENWTWQSTHVYHINLGDLIVFLPFFSTSTLRSSRQSRYLSPSASKKIWILSREKGYDFVDTWKSIYWQAVRCTSITIPGSLLGAGFR